MYTPTHIHTHYYRVTAATPQFTATELLLRNYKALFLCLKYTSSDSTLCSTQLTPSLSFSLLHTHAHTLPFIILSWKNNNIHSRTGRYSPLLSLEVLSRSAFAFPFLCLSVSPPVCSVRLKVLTFQRKSYIFFPEYTKGLIHSSLSSLTAQTHLQLYISLPPSSLSFPYFSVLTCISSIFPSTRICSVFFCLPLLFLSFY